MMSTSSSKLVTVVAGEVDELPCSLDDGAAFGGAGNRDAAPAPELEQPLVAEQPQRPQHGVCIDVARALPSSATTSRP
jgi:hypothetical protein